MILSHPHRLVNTRIEVSAGEWDGARRIKGVRYVARPALRRCVRFFSGATLSLCSLFQPSATALQPIAEKVSAEIEPHREVLDTTIRGAIETPPETKVLVARLEGAHVLLREPGVRRGRPAERPRSQEPNEPKNATYKNAMVGAPFLLRSRVRRFRGSRTAAEPVFGPDAGGSGRDLHTRLRAASGDHRESVGPAGEETAAVRRPPGLVELRGPPRALRPRREAGGLLPHGRASLPGGGGPLRQEQQGGRTLVHEVSRRTPGPRGWWHAVRRSLAYYGRTRRWGPNRRHALATERTFFRRHQQRMAYAPFQRRGLPLGSGPVEAACKSIVRTRLGRSGMRWSREGGQRILNFRCYVKSGVWNEFWETYQQLRRSA